MDWKKQKLKIDYLKLPTHQTMDVSTQILPEEHTLDNFIDKLEELCDCKGQGYIPALEVIQQLKQENKKLQWKVKSLLPYFQEHRERTGQNDAVFENE